MTYYKCGSIHPTQNSNVVVDTASGAIANFETPLAMPLVKTKFDVNAKQDLHGYDYPWTAGGGKNLFDMNSAVSGYINGTGDVISNPDKENMTSDFIPVTPSAKYVYSFYPTVAEEPWTGWAFYSEKDMKTVIGRRNASYSSQPTVITIPEGAHYIRIGSRYLSGGCAQFEEGSSATSWTPYENICPIEGVSEINAFHCGSNFFDISTKTNDKALKWTDGDTFNDTKSIVSDYIEVKEGMRFTSNYLAQWCCYDKNKNYLGNILSGSLVKTSGSDRVDNTIPSGYGVYYLRLGYRSSQNNNEDMTEKTDIMLNIGNTAIPFEPYNGNTEVINLGNTYYGGHFTQDKAGHRQFEVTHGVKLFSELDFGYSNNGGKWESYRFYALIDKLRGANVKCSNYEAFHPTSAGTVMDNKTLIAPTGNDYVYIRDDEYTTKEEFKTANANTQLWYELAEPFTVALPDGQPIKTLPGINNIFCDTGDTSLQFRKIG